MPFKRVCVVGLGYIGLPTAAILASRGIEVIGVDVDPKAVEIINGGKAHFAEPDLDIVVQAVVGTGRLRAMTEAEPADAFIIAVPTPFDDERRPDLSCIEAAARSIAPALAPGNLVILESTVPVGASERMAGWLAAERPDLRFPSTDGENSDIRIAHCPERVLPGRVLTELVANDRVIGGVTRRCAELAEELYRKFVRGECMLTDCRTAELAKLTENAFRDVNIAFANELSLVAEEVGVNVWELIELANHHPRVNVLSPGPGVGGHCIAVDPWFIIDSAPDVTPLIATARNVNDGMPGRVLARVERSLADRPEARVACLGLAFKADVDDLRSSPAVLIAEQLAERLGDRLLVVEPNIGELPAKLAEHGASLSDLGEAVEAAEVVLLLVDHREFRALDPRRLEGRDVIDTRGVWKRTGAAS